MSQNQFRCWYRAPFPKVRDGPITPHMMEAVPKVWVEGHHLKCHSKHMDRNGSGNRLPSLCCITITDVWDVRENPGLNKYLYNRCHKCRHTLGPEHGSWGNLHVMSKLHVANERHALCHRNVAARYQKGGSASCLHMLLTLCFCFLFFPFFSVFIYICYAECFRRCTDTHPNVLNIIIL